MGNGSAEAAVADSGPIIHLYEIGRPALLSVFTQIYVADAVWRETVASGRVPETEFAQFSSVRQTVTAEEVDRVRAIAADDKLHTGELETIALCQQINVLTLLTDDLSARSASVRLGIRPVGSLGVVVRAARNRMIGVDEAEHCILRLFDLSSLFVTRAIVDFAIAELRKTLGS